MAMRSISLRLDEETVDRLERESRRAGQSRVEYAKTLLEEGLRMEAHPGIVFRSGPAGRRPGLAKGPDVWEVARLFDGRTDLSQQELTVLLDLSPVDIWQLKTALQYYREYKGEIDEWIRRVDEEAEKAEAE